LALHGIGGAAPGFLLFTLIAWFAKHDANLAARLEVMRFREVGTLIGSGIGLAFRQLSYEPPEITWDAEGLTYTRGGSRETMALLPHDPGH